MKRILQLPLALLIVSMCFYACTDSLSTQKKDDAAQDAAADTEEVVGDGSGENTLLPDEIAPETASSWVTSYQALATDTKVPCGFKLSHGDLQGILADPNFDNPNDIFAMHGYDGSEFHLIFCLDTNTTLGAGEYRFFDFTQPCPRYCPGFSACNSCQTLSSCTSAPTKGVMPNGYWFGRNGMTNPLRSGLAGEAYLLPLDSLPGGNVYWYVCSGACTTQPEAVAGFQPCATTGENLCPTF